MRRFNQKKGMSLVEVLLATAILGAVAVTLILIETESIQHAADAAELQELTLLARERLQTVHGEPSSGESAGSFDSPHQNAQWQLSTREVDWPAPTGDETVAMVEAQLRVVGPGGTSIEITEYWPVAAQDPESDE